MYNVINRICATQKRKGGIVINIGKLKGKIVENGYSTREFAKLIGITYEALNRRLNGRVEFTIQEANNAAKALNLTTTETSEIFFYELNIAQMRQTQA